MEENGGLLALHTTDRHERIRALRLRVGDEILELFAFSAFSAVIQSLHKIESPPS